jgi:hypothetical protein
MAVDYGTDIAALTDLPDPEVLVSGETNAAYAEARRLLTPTGALEEVGETAPYDSMDVRDWLGQRLDATTLDDLQAQVSQVLVEDPRALAADVSVPPLAAGALRISSQVEGTQGPFSFVLTVDGVTAMLLRGT